MISAFFLAAAISGYFGDHQNTVNVESSGNNHFAFVDVHNDQIFARGQVFGRLLEVEGDAYGDQRDVRTGARYLYPLDNGVVILKMFPVGRAKAALVLDVTRGKWTFNGFLDRHIDDKLTVAEFEIRRRLSKNLSIITEWRYFDGSQSTAVGIRYEL